MLTALGEGRHVSVAGVQLDWLMAVLPDAVALGELERGSKVKTEISAVATHCTRGPRHSTRWWCQW